MSSTARWMRASIPVNNLATALSLSQRQFQHVNGDTDDFMKLGNGLMNCEAVTTPTVFCIWRSINPEFLPDMRKISAPKTVIVRYKNKPT
jgi:hypothetical protein